MLTLRLHALGIPEELPDQVCLVDHIGGFDQRYHNPLLTHIDRYCHERRHKIQIHYAGVITDSVQTLYPYLEFFRTWDAGTRKLFDSFVDYRCHPDLEYKNFLCSFNGSPHVSRKLLVSALQRWGYFNPETCSKNFQYTADELDGHLGDYLDLDRHRFYKRFFISDNSQEFFHQIHSFGHVKYNHAQNIYGLERQLTGSFLHVVSETLATSYYPFVTEKFLYSVITRGLFLAYAQPGWHDHLERYWGFRRYNRIFDYDFDAIQNPVERLVELISMISKFSVLSSDDWRDLYEMEYDTIEHNYDHYFSGKYLDYYQQQ